MRGNSPSTYSFSKLRITRSFFLPDVVSASILAIFIGAAVKGGISEEFETVVYTGWIASFREYAGFIGAAGFSVLMALWLKHPRLIAPSISSPIFWLLIFKLIFLLRFIGDISIAIKCGASLVATIFAWMIISEKSRGPHWDTFYASLIKGLIYLICLIVAINIYLYFYASESASWKGRFIGIFHHPNFLGVNLAICLAIFLMLAISPNAQNSSSLKAVGIGAGVVSSLFLVIISGSRTGMVGALTALVLFFVVRKFRGYGIIAWLLCGLVAAYILSQIYGTNIITSTPGLERILSNQNTRDEVWAIMIDNFMSNPLFGAGKSVGATAGSYLRAAAVGGVFMVAALLVAVLLSLKRSFSKFSYVERAWVVPMSVVAVCAVTEGFLVDTLSFGSAFFSFMVILFSLKRSAIRRA